MVQRLEMMMTAMMEAEHAGMSHTDDGKEAHAASHVPLFNVTVFGISVAIRTCRAFRDEMNKVSKPCTAHRSQFCLSLTTAQAGG